MLSNLTESLRRGLRSFGSFTPGQKAVTAVAVVAIVVGGFFFTQWAARPTMVPLYTDLESSDASAVVEELTSLGTPYELMDGGTTIMVPAGVVNDARIAVSGQDIIKGDSGGWGVYDELSMTASQDQQQVAKIRGLEGALVETLLGIDGVDTAVVHLAVPEKDVFSKEQDKTTASVLVDTGSGELDARQVQGISSLVASSVPELAPEDVTVTDQRGEVLSSADAGGGGAADNRATMTQEYETRVAASVEQMLEQVVGVGHAVVQLTADLDFDKTQTTTKRTTGDAKSPPVSKSEDTETYTGGGTPVGGPLGGSGVLGPDNINVPSGAGAGTDGTYKKTSATVNNAMTEVMEQRSSAPGKVNRLNLAVLLDAETAKNVDRAEIQSLAATAIGLDAARGDTATVSTMAFNTDAQTKAAEELAAAKKAQAAAAQGSFYKNVGLALLIAAIIVFALIKGRRKKGPSTLTDDERLQIEQLQRALELQSAGRPEIENIPSLPVLEAAPSNPKAELAALARTEIGELVQAQPEEVAQLLRGWLADRRT